MVFDLEEILDYYTGYFDVRYLEQLQDNSNKDKGFSTMKVYDKKLLLDYFVDQLTETSP